MSKNPRTIHVQAETGRETIENVQTWWREGATLVVELTDESTRRFSLGEVIDQ